MRKSIHCAGKFYSGGVNLYPKDDLYREMAFIAYYFHWSQEEILGLEHTDRKHWCREISYINEKVESSEDKSSQREKSILEMTSDR